MPAVRGSGSPAWLPSSALVSCSAPRSVARRVSSRRPCWTARTSPIAAVEVHGTNGAYVHDRRSGEREALATYSAATLTRHEVDDLYSVALAQGLSAKVCVLAGTAEQASPVPAEIYGRLAGDLRSNGVVVIADLSGPLMEAALEGGVDILKTSDEDLTADGLLEPGAGPDDIIEAIHGLRDHGVGAGHVIISRAEEDAIVWCDGEVLAARGLASRRSTRRAPAIRSRPGSPPPSPSASRSTSRYGSGWRRRR